MRYIEEKESVNPFQVIISIFILAICLFTFYNLRGGSVTEKTLPKIANLQYTGMDGKILNFYEPLSVWMLQAWKSTTRLSYIVSFQSYLAIIYSIFLHLVLLLFERNKWRLNHHIILFITAFSFFNLKFTYSFVSELLCAVFILSLVLSCKVESVFDIILLVVFSGLAYLSNLSAFILLFSIFVVKISIVKMKEDKSKTAVFYKKKSIAGKVLAIYFVLFLTVLTVLCLYDFFGPNSFRFLGYSFFNLCISFLPIMGMLFIARVLLRTERELNGVVSSIVFFLIFMGVIYYSYGMIKPFKFKTLKEQKSLERKESSETTS